MLTVLNHIDIVNDDLNAVGPDLKEFWILGRNLYNIIVNTLTNFD